MLFVLCDWLCSFVSLSKRVICVCVRVRVCVCACSGACVFVCGTCLLLLISSHLTFVESRSRTKCHQEKKVWSWISWIQPWTISGLFSLIPHYERERERERVVVDSCAREREQERERVVWLHCHRCRMCTTPAHTTNACTTCHLHTLIEPRLTTPNKGPQATNVWGLKLLVYEALSY